jgi:hypothetical protein
MTNGRIACAGLFKPLDCYCAASFWSATLSAFVSYMDKRNAYGKYRDSFGWPKYFFGTVNTLCCFGVTRCVSLKKAFPFKRFGNFRETPDGVVRAPSQQTIGVFPRGA